MNELEQGRKDLSQGLETPLADYASLHRLLTASSTVEAVLHLLHRLRPRARGLQLPFLLKIRTAKFSQSLGRVTSICRWLNDTSASLVGT